MGISRRHFLKSTFGSIIMIGMGNTLQSFRFDDFELPGKKELLLRFALASDGHYGQPDTDYVALHLKMTQWLNKEKSDRGLDFITVNGDIFHNDPAYLSPVKEAWDKLQATYYVTRGNHDRVDEATWEKTWGIPFYHHFEKKGIGFVILDSSNIKGEFIGPDAERTKSLVEKYQKNKMLFVFTHIPLVKWSKWDADRPDMIKYFGDLPNLKAVFHGHDHDLDDVKEKNGKPFFWDSHVASNWGTPYHGYRIVEILKDGSVLTYQMNPRIGEQVNQNKLV